MPEIDPIIEPVLRVTALSCERDRRNLFTDLDFSLNFGELVQVVGENGRGKTTLLRILIGLFEDFEGEVSWSLERPPLYLGHQAGIKNALSVVENLHWLCRLSGLIASPEKIHTALEATNLLGYEQVRCGSLSAGQVKRVSLARFFLLDNPCWIMDEPFSSIDADGVERLQAHMCRHVERGGLVLFSSHETFTSGADVRILELNA